MSLKSERERELIVFETTGVTHRPAMTFEQAKKTGEAKLEENAPQRFVAAIDVCAIEIRRHYASRVA